MTCGVPQGSALSPTLFNVYLAPLASLVKQRGVDVITYADDTQLVFSFQDFSSTAFDKFRQFLLVISGWMTTSCLKLNAEKTEVLFFNQPSPPPPILWWPKELNPPPSPVTTARNLGFRLDTEMSCKSQINHVSSICFWKMKALRRFLHFLPMDCRKTIVHAVITSQLDYANSLYLGLPVSLLGKLQTIQNAAARLIRNIPLRHHITPHLRTLHWLPVKRRIEFKVLTLAYRALNDIGPMYLKKRVHKYQPTRTLRSSSLEYLVVPRFKKTRMGGRSFSVKTATLWNHMPIHIRKANSETIFRKLLNTWLFSLS